ncbi:MAG: cysteine hydrolase family protein [Candidatus Hodarchaeota archaeon]
MRLPPLRKVETSLIIIDMQNDFCHPEGYFGKRGRNRKLVLDVIPKLVGFLKDARKLGIPRIFTKATHPEYTNSPTFMAVRRAKYGEERINLCLPNTWGSDIIRELTPLDDEPVITKHRYSAFFETNLPVILKTKRIQNLLITGVATNVCVESTVMDAFAHDYLPVVIRDCVAAGNNELHESSLKNIALNFGIVASAADVLKMIQ